MRSAFHRGTAACLLAACLALAGCGSPRPLASGPGVTAISVTLGTDQPLTGPASPGYSEIAAASTAFFNYVNDHGGVYGRSIHLTVLNDAYNPTQTVGAINQLVLFDNVFGIFAGVGTAAQPETEKDVLPLLEGSQVPDLFPVSGCPCLADGTDNPYTFGWQPSATIEGKILGSYIMTHFPRARVGVLFQDDASGHAALAGLRDEVRAVVARETYALGDTTLNAQIGAIRAAKASVLVDFTLPAYTAIGQLTASRLNYHPHLVVWSGGSDPTTVTGLIHTYSGGQVSGASLLEGAVTDAFLPSPEDTSNPWIRLFRMIDAQDDSNVPFDGNVEYGMASAYTFVQALLAAGKNLTRQSMIAGIAGHGTSWQGPALVPFSYSSHDHSGLSGAQLGQIENGKLVLLGQPLTTTAGPKAAITPYLATQAPPPTGGLPSALGATGGTSTNG
jgi:ABC-type branched-subunit amino acid transport system substrate-binding protein